MMTFPIDGKRKFMFQTPNQSSSHARWDHQLSVQAMSGSSTKGVSWTQGRGDAQGRVEDGSGEGPGPGVKRLQT
jgi:hypothetical protein